MPEDNLNDSRWKTIEWNILKYPAIHNEKFDCCNKFLTN